MSGEIRFHNDYDRIADRIEDAIETLLSALRETPEALKGGDCRAVNTSLFVDAMFELKQIHGWAEGLADSHRKMAVTSNTTA